MTKDKVVESPRDTTVEGVVIDVQQKTWKEVISPDKINAFDNPDDQRVFIKFECKFKDTLVRGEDSFRFYETPLDNSQLGKFLIKYDELKVGVKIKVNYNGKGFAKISLD